MQTRIERDDRGRECLVRSGVGVVTAMAPVGIVDPTGQSTLYRVGITCEVPTGRLGSIRFTAQPLIDSGSHLYRTAAEAHRDGREVRWSARWERHEWIEPEIPISSLNLVTDAQSLLLELTLSADGPVADLVVPDFIPDSWLEGSA